MNPEHYHYFLVCHMRQPFIIIGHVREDGIYAVFRDNQDNELMRCLTSEYGEISEVEAAAIIGRAKKWSRKCSHAG